MVDPGRLLDLLDRLEEERRHLERLGRLPPEELLEDPDLLAAVKYRFVVAIEACIDVGHHIVASEGLRAPSDYGDVFVVLGETGFIDEELADELRRMAGFRNLLVQGYQRVDDRRVVELLGTRLGDLAAFRRSIAASALGDESPPAG